MNQPSSPPDTSTSPQYNFIVRIQPNIGKPDFCGTGFLVSPLHVATCLHVADLATLRGQRTARNPWQLRVRCGDELRHGSVAAVCDPDGVLIRLERPFPQEPVRLLVDMRAGDEDALARQGALIVGFTESIPDTLVESPIKRVVNSLGHAATRQLCEIQIEGGRREGMSGSPVLVQAAEGPACLGVLCAGGEDAVNSRFMLAGGLVEMMDRCGVVYPTPLHAQGRLRGFFRHCGRYRSRASIQLSAASKRASAAKRCLPGRAYGQADSAHRYQRNGWRGEDGDGARRLPRSSDSILFSGWSSLGHRRKAAA